jgi:hypothetical protein
VVFQTGETPEEKVAKDMIPANLLIERRQKGEWIPISD